MLNGEKCPQGGYVDINVVRRNYNNNAVYYVIEIDGVEINLTRGVYRRVGFDTAVELASIFNMHPKDVRDSFGFLKIPKPVLIAAPQFRKVGEKSATLFHVAENHLNELDGLIVRWIERGIKRLMDRKAVLRNFSIR